MTCPPCNGDCCGMHDCAPPEAIDTGDEPVVKTSRGALWSVLALLAAFWGGIAIAVARCAS